jgi:chromosome segregation ATPase
MSDIYPQSPEDSMKELSEMHPLSQKLKALESERNELKARLEELGRESGELLAEKNRRMVTLERELEKANWRIEELEMELKSFQAEIDIRIVELGSAERRFLERQKELSELPNKINEALRREEARHKITQNNLRQAQQQCDHLNKTMQAIQAVMMIGEAPF